MRNIYLCESKLCQIIGQNYAIIGQKCQIYLCESINGKNYAEYIFVRIDNWTKLYGIYICATR